MPLHKDTLTDLNKKASIADKLKSLHLATQQHHPFISRIAVALYDHDTDLLKTFIYSSNDQTLLTNYQAKLSDIESLQGITENADPRVINDLTTLEHSQQTHTKALLDAGYLASYTLPMIVNDHFFGFVFFNAAEKNVFTEHVMVELDMIGHMIGLLIYNERSSIRTLVATVKSALDMTHSRDPETAYHLERMSRYTRLIAKTLANKYNFDDQYIEHIYLFAPLHDLGKIKVPDRILLKPDKLTNEEFSIMKSHPQDGRELIDSLLENYGLNGIGHVDMLRNIANYHHECVDGSGYPEGLIGEAIPIEARIVTVADVFDALTSERPYKKAWSNEAAYEKLKELSGKQFDPQCVDALLAHTDEIEEIQRTFIENDYG
ncbi:HD-GYP domain-containing protein [Alkalimarinus sediminis]|uniref:HD domain-containing protein n=1 Tax=Alkalimarinus sediminis TaxID=1632866 RepID=A0A9E8HKN1_9ALTE|nr:HD domain-containing phosphohydrolase [Alkalimarinus sediminis]UZW74448.1 HD domain-containing protein [Alkalimarinus sediminis]